MNDTIEISDIDKSLWRASEKWPDRVAFSCNGASLSYLELRRKAEATAVTLRSAGVKPGDRVALALFKGLEMPVAIHAVWMVGAAFVPLDPTAPVARLVRIISDCAISVVIGGPRSEALIKKIVAEKSVHVVGVEIPDCDCSLPDEQVNGFECHENRRDDLAYIIFTSGSTGTPKGICHTFASGSAFAHAWIRHYGLSPDDVFFNTVPLHFDFSLADFFTPAMVGASTELVPEPTLLFPASLSKLLEDRGGTIWSSVPYTFVQLCQRGALDKRDVSRLRWLIYGGEPMPPSALPLLRDAFSAKISNSYGPAEVNQVSEYTVPDTHPANEPIPIGRTMDHATFVRTSDGELLVSSSSMMTGYWNNPEQNARSFTTLDGKRFYRTGDRVEQDPSGLWVFLGREDRQAKVRGYRIELDEIELAMNSHAAVAEAAAVVSSDGAKILGFVTLLENHELSAADLKSFLQSKLPGYMVPDDVEFKEAFTKTSTGKINRRQLLEADN
ncbi:amino acid adenylation domain-containing protein [Ruegeria profundi]|uniref:amino acid adenylation domain-containing protein n=1 Tax=Ruegeria profundi TaxID=1685378 RepID=UPI001CD60003|nr:amino acid adenylation domain-containing protein [Ruegeria profundi]MCA0929571.1 amino acid adenylation domain-containing protein [Ruegeria profundi]